VSEESEYVHDLGDTGCPQFLKIFIALLYLKNTRTKCHAVIGEGTFVVFYFLHRSAIGSFNNRHIESGGHFTQEAVGIYVFALRVMEQRDNFVARERQERPAKCPR